MSRYEFTFEKPGLLVSVRDPAEALAALEGGADVIDIKEPSRGALGGADRQTISEITLAVNGRTLVTAAMGELLDVPEPSNGVGLPAIPQDVAMFKLGLQGCARQRDWQSRWKRAIESWTSPLHAAKPVAVVYADWQAAKSPPPEDVLRAGVAQGCPALLIDTWDKTAGSLFDHWPGESLRGFIAEVRSQNLAVVLAGSLTVKTIAAATRLGPTLVAVRAAACDAGRSGAVSIRRVRELKSVVQRSGAAMSA